MRAVRAAVALAGVAAVGFAAALVVAPGQASGLLPIGAIADATPLSEDSIRALAFLLVGVLCVLWVAWTGAPTRTYVLPEGPLSEPDVGFRTLREAPPERATPGPTVGGSFDRRLRRTASAALRGDDADEVREDVRALAVAVVAHAEGCSTERARRRMAEGEWTDDPVAAAYVADREASLPVSRRLSAWLRPHRTTVRRVERSVTALEERLDGEGER
jgi:hypothetical protein